MLYGHRKALHTEILILLYGLLKRLPIPERDSQRKRSASR